MKKASQIELLSPAGSMEKMKIALKFGADAVYAGVPDFSLRVRINDFTFAGLKKAVEYCHKQRKKIYATINIFAHNLHLSLIEKHVGKLRDIGVDGLIVSDPGILDAVKKIWPRAEIHLSTQANCTNWRSADFWHKAGVKRIILGREVTLTEIREIHRRVPKVELEYFVHGAMCMAYSGRCFISKYFANRSGNSGDCSQPCRWQYFLSSQDTRARELEIIEEEHGSYILNSQDLCLLEYIPDLVNAGVVCLKIEGRAKSAYYQSVVAGIYRSALDMLLEKGEEKFRAKVSYWKNELEKKLVHRGYTAGFLLGGTADQNLNSSHKLSGWEFCGQVIKKKEEKNQKFKIYIKVHNSLKVGDKIEIIEPYYDIIKLKVKDLIDADTGTAIKEAHGGQGRVAILETDKDISEFSTIRRRL